MQGSCSGDAQLNREGRSRGGRAGTPEQGFPAALTLKEKENGGHWHMEGSEGRHEAETGRAGRGRARGPARQAALVCPAVESHRAFSRVQRQQVTLTGRQGGPRSGTGRSVLADAEQGVHLTADEVEAAGRV